MSCNCGSDCEIPVGPKGVQGEKGDKGDKGDAGAPGAQGSPGQNGLNGDEIPLQWQDMNIINDWIVPSANQPPQFAVQNGRVYFRGRVTPGPTTAGGSFADNVFAQGMTFNPVLIYHTASIPPDSDAIIWNFSSGTVTSVSWNAVSGDLLLDSIVPYYIR